MSDQLNYQSSTTIDVMRFVDSKGESVRFDLSKPWWAGEFVYATDAKILIRIDGKLWGGEVDNEGRKPDVDSILRYAEKIKIWQPLPEFPACGLCGGVGDTTEKCGECHGAGDHECSCGHWHDCDCCGGSGYVGSRCGKCNVHFGAGVVARKYANSIASLPGVEWGAAEGVDHIIFFRFAGGIGGVATLLQEGGK